MNPMNRRQLLRATGVIALAGVAARLPVSAQENGSLSGSRFFDVKNYGAVGDGKSLDTVSINRAIVACHASGGGVVYLPPGVYLSGTVILKSNVTLHLEAGATLLGSKNISDYTPQPQVSSKPGAVAKPFVFGSDAADTTEKHLIFARDAENIGLTGLGRIDGQGPSFWVPSDKKLLPPEEAWREAATHAWMAISRPSPMLEFYNCKNVHIEDVRIENSPGWTIRPLECDNVFIRGVTIKNPYGINTDGIDVIGCKNVLISDCVIDTGDDAICLKSESPYGGEVRVTKNITITNCVLTCCCNGLKFGTATFGSFENITFSNSIIFSEDVEPKSRVFSGIALEMVDGGSLEGVLISNIRMQRVRTPIFIRIGNRHPRADGATGTLRGVRIENLHATGSILTSSITGQPGFDVEDITLSGIRIESEESGEAAWASRTIPELPKGYPEASMFGRLPAYGLYCRHVKGLRLRDVEFQAATGEERPAIFCDDVKDVEIDGLRSSPINGAQPVIKLVQTREALLRACVAPKGTKTFLEVQGAKTEQVTLMNSELSRAETVVASGAEVPKNAVTLAGNAEGKRAGT